MEDIHTSLKEGILDHLNHLFFFYLKSFRDCFDSSSVSIIFSLSLPIKKKESSLFPPAVSDYVGRNVVLTAVLALRRYRHVFQFPASSVSCFQLKSYHLLRKEHVHQYKSLIISIKISRTYKLDSFPLFAQKYLYIYMFIYIYVFIQIYIISQQSVALPSFFFFYLF